MGNTPRSDVKPFSQNDVFRSKHVIDGRFSPVGDRAVYVLAETKTLVSGQEQPNTSLWEVDLATQKCKRLTSTQHSAFSPVYTVDGRSLLFLSARDPDNPVPQIHRLPLEGGEAEELTNLKQGVSMFELSPDGKWIALVALNEVPEPLGPNEHILINRHLYRADPIPGYLKDASQAVFVLPASGGACRQITKDDGLIYELAWSPDSNQIAYPLMLREGHKQLGVADLRLVDREGKKASTLIRNRLVLVTLFWTDDGKRIGYSATSKRKYDNQPELWTLKVDGRQERNRTRKLDRAVGGLMQVNSPSGRAVSRTCLSDDGKSVYVSVSQGGESGIWEVALNGVEKTQQVIQGERVARLLDSRKDRLLFTEQGMFEPSKLVLLQLGSGVESVLTRHNDAWRKRVLWPEVENSKVNSTPKVEVEYWVLKPRDRKPPYKTVLYIHGGPHVAIGCGYCEDILELVGAGYAVVIANPRGSTGYGQVFAQANIPDWGPTEEQDLNAVLDELIGRKIADPGGLGVMGYSGGGHLAAWMAVKGKKGRFSAAIPEQGLYNMFSMYGVSDAGVALIERELGGPPHKFPGRYWNLSPVAHAHDCETPMLLIQGENDLRSPMEQAEQLYTIMKFNDREVVLLRLQNCNHGLQVSGPPALRRFRMNEIKKWLKEHL